MKRTELERKLKGAGWIIKPGGKHNKAKHPDKPGITLTIPRGSTIKEITANSILSDAG